MTTRRDFLKGALGGAAAATVIATIRRDNPIWSYSHRHSTFPDGSYVEEHVQVEGDTKTGTRTYTYTYHNARGAVFEITPHHNWIEDWMIA